MKNLKNNSLHDNYSTDICAKSFHIKTFGCQMNEYDSTKIADILVDQGYIRAPKLEEAEVIILNTCHIREKAAEKVYSELGRLRVRLTNSNKNKRNNQARYGMKTSLVRRSNSQGNYKDYKGNFQGKSKRIFVVAGCVAQAQGKEIIRRAPFVDIVLGSQNYHRIAELLERFYNTREKIVDTEFPIENKFDHLAAPHISNLNFAEQQQSTNIQSRTIHKSQRARVCSHLAIQEGCDKFCTFCVVPYTRGSEFSRSVREIVAEAKQLSKLGVKEITLLGQNVNAYHGIDFKERETNLAGLLRVISDVKGIERIRYTTSHPCDIDDDLLRAHSELPKLMPYLHLPIQSGSNDVLRRMNRKHEVEEYLIIIDKLRKLRADIALTSDFIVGFPSETDQDFEETMNLVKEVNFAGAFSFKYSKRAGTPAAEYKDQVPEDVKSLRLTRLQELLNSQKRDFNRSQIGKRLDVLVESYGREQGQLTARSPYLQPVHFTADDKNIGNIVEVEITNASFNSLSASLIT